MPISKLVSQASGPNGTAATSRNVDTSTMSGAILKMR